MMKRYLCRIGIISLFWLPFLGPLMLPVHVCLIQYAQDGVVYRLIHLHYNALYIHVMYIPVILSIALHAMGQFYDWVPVIVEIVLLPSWCEHYVENRCLMAKHQTTTTTTTNIVRKVCTIPGALCMYRIHVWTGSSLVQILTWCLFDAVASSKSMDSYIGRKANHIIKGTNIKLFMLLKWSPTRSPIS